MNQQELGLAFYRGETSGKASNIKIEDFPDLGLTAVIGYGHAVYATRNKETGYTVYYEGWDGYSSTTGSQLTKLDLSARSNQIGVDEIVDEEKKRGTLRRGDKKARRNSVAP
jgi:hypothetical protein